MHDTDEFPRQVFIPSALIHSVKKYGIIEPVSSPDQLLPAG
jgi:hypothetical protein